MGFFFQAVTITVWIQRKLADLLPLLIPGVTLTHNTYATCRSAKHATDVSLINCPLSASDRLTARRLQPSSLNALPCTLLNRALMFFLHQSPAHSLTCRCSRESFLPVTRQFNPLTPTVAIWPECPDVNNYKWRLNTVWHGNLYSCSHNNAMATVDVKGLSLTAAQDAPTIKFIAAELLSVYTVSKFLNSVLICAGLTVN